MHRLFKVNYFMWFGLSFLFVSKTISLCAQTDTIIIEPLISTFLGGNERNSYGADAPDSLQLLWKFKLGTGKTVISRKIGTKYWSGAGWTGQPLLIKENGELYLIIGAYDHHLKKIRARDAKLIWEYQFDDVVKGTGTFYENPREKNDTLRYLILQGSRLGVGNYLDSEHIPSFRAISYLNGKEVWRMDVPWTDSYSRDADASALIIDSLAYIGLENSIFYVLDPDPKKAKIKDGMLQPEIVNQCMLYKEEDVRSHGVPKISNIVTEASPSLLGNRIFIASGSGHVFGYNLDVARIDWDFKTGSDIDGSPVVTTDSCILQTLEKQYIKGPGGVFKFNPKEKGKKSVEWFFPVESKEYEGWEGGIIGSVCVNDTYIESGKTRLAAFAAIDGRLYLIGHDQIDPKRQSTGPDGKSIYKQPVIFDSYRIGPSISTPIFIDSTIIAASYNGIFMFRVDKNNKLKLTDSMAGRFESTPICWNKRVYIASRDGYLYCLGQK